MNILFIGTDTKIFQEGSSVRERFIGFSSLGEEVHIVVARPSVYARKDIITSNVFAYPTTRSGNIFAIIKSFFIGYRILNQDKKSKWVISVQDPFEQGWVGYLLSRIFKRPLHVQLHTDMLSPFFSRHSFFNLLRGLISRPVFRHAKRIRVDAKRMKESLIDRYGLAPEKIDVLQIYIDVPRLTAPSCEKQIEGDYIIYVGRFEPEKNVESIIQGFARAAVSLPSLKLLLLGSGGLRSSYESLASKLGLLDKVVVVPWSNDVGVFLKHARALVVASWFEGFALVLVEALVNECPVITTDVGAVGGLIPRNYVTIFPQDDTLALSESMIRVLLNGEEERVKAREAKSVILKSIPNDIQSYTRIFKESLEKSL